MSKKDSERRPSPECVADSDRQTESADVFEKVAYCVITNSDGEIAKDDDEVFPLNNEDSLSVCLLQVFLYIFLACL